MPSSSSLGLAAGRSLSIDSTLPDLPPLKVLFIDNYDSFSYNIVNLIAVITHATPIVRFNTCSWDSIRTLISEENIDAIVVGPGPGNPHHAKDLGVCQQIYTEACLLDIPIFGICLGLQAQCSTTGGIVRLAHEPMHGRLSKLDHDGKGIFEGIPQQIQVVRYNSLVADPSTLSASLEVSAWSNPSDGTAKEIMGLRQTALAGSNSSFPPLRESVQFHPESICTEHGRRLCYNFFRMVIERKKAREETVGAKPSVHAEHPPSIVGASLKPFTLLCQKLPIFVESEQVFLSLYNHDSSSVSSETTASSFWLDSSRVEAGRSRFSYMGDNSGPLSYSASYSLVDPSGLHIRRLPSNEGVRHEIIDIPQQNSKSMKHQVWQELQQLLESRNATRCFLDSNNIDNVLYEEHASSSAASSVESQTLPFNFEGGFVGYIGYAMKQVCTPDSLPPIRIDFPSDDNNSSASASSSSSSTAAPSSRVPDLAFLFADRFIAFDHEKKEMYLLCLATTAAATSSSASSVEQGKVWMREATTKLKSIVSSPINPSSSSSSAVAAAPSATSPLPEGVSISNDWFQTESQYLHAIRTCLSAIKAGESYEICLTNQLNMKVELETKDSNRTHGLAPIEYYRLLRKVNPAPYAAFFQLQYAQFPHASFSDPTLSRPPNTSTSAWNIACSSPERFLQVDRSRVVESKPIKGTLPRGATPEEDAVLHQRLSESMKDFAENLMIVDLLRNDLTHVCEVGSVVVPKLMDVESYATVHQLVSTIRGKLRSSKSENENEASTWDLLQAAFPPGSMTGAPKLRTCQILSVLEVEPSYNSEAKQASQLISNTRERGIYSGCIGFIGINGGMSDLNVVIRTAIMHQSVQPVSNDTHRHSTHFSIGAGGAIVYLSDPHEEYQEVLLKTKALVSAIQQAARSL